MNYTVYFAEPDVCAWLSFQKSQILHISFPFVLLEGHGFIPMAVVRNEKNDETVVD